MASKNPLVLSGGVLSELVAADTLNVPGPATAVGQTSLGGASGSESFRVVVTASAVNRGQVAGSATGSSVVWSAQGGDTNIGNTWSTKGTGVHLFTTGGGVQFRVTDTASAVNYLQATGGATGSGVALVSSGSDTDVTAFYQTKGAGVHNFTTSSGSTRQMQVSHTASSVNYLRMSGGATGNAPVLSSQGTDTNVDINLTPRGTGRLVLTAGIFNAQLSAPATSTSSGSAGDIRWDADYIFVCTATNTWKRTLLTTF